jgi:hypothetical protein
VTKGKAEGISFWEKVPCDSLPALFSYLNCISRSSSQVKMPSAIKKPRTLYDKVFEDHIVNEQSDGTILLYIGT